MPASISWGDNELFIKISYMYKGIGNVGQLLILFTANTSVTDKSIHFRNRCDYLSQDYHVFIAVQF